MAETARPPRADDVSCDGPQVKSGRSQRWSRCLGVAALSAVCVSLFGCSHGESPLDYLNIRNSFFNPAEVGRFDKTNPFGRVTPVTWPILDSLAVNDPPREPWKDSVPPSPADLQVIHKPYRLGAGDVVTVSVFQLVVPGQESVQTRQVNSQGDITLDFVGTVHAAGLTTRQLRHRIIDTLINTGEMAPPGPHQPGPQVNVELTEARRRVFSLIGSVVHAGTYNITTPDFRLLDALALAGDMSMSPQLKWLYVIREEPKSTAKTPVVASSTVVKPSAANPAPSGLSSGMLSAIANQLAHPPKHVSAKSRAQKEQELLNEAISGNGQSSPSTQPRYVYFNGHWVALNGSQMQTGEPSTQPKTSASTPVYDFAAAMKMQKAKPWMPRVKVIRINIKKLREGDPRYNIVIHSGDVINVPDVKPEFYYMMGNVTRPGAYTISGGRITIKQAVAAAGNLGPIAIPRRCELIRRIGHNQEMIIQVNLQAIFDGTAPDIFLKNNDILNVGTDFFAEPIAVIRNGFSAAYGFGFTYDRNYYIQPTIIQPGG